MKIKYFIFTVVLATAILCSAGLAQAKTTDNSALIINIQTQLLSLMKQAVELLKQQKTAVQPVAVVSPTVAAAAISTSGGGQVSDPDFNYAKPVIDSLSSNSGSKGDKITINGSHFSGVTSVVISTPGSTQPSSTINPDSVTGTHVVFTIPDSVVSNNSGTRMLSVVRPTGTSNLVMFTIFGPSEEPIVITAPHGGEKWTAGETHNITWEHIPSVSNLNLTLVDYSKDPEVSTQLTSIQPGQNSYLWTIPSRLSGNGFRMVITYGDSFGNQTGRIMDGNFFSITPTNPPAPIPVPAQPVITSLSENSGSAGDSINIYGTNLDGANGVVISLPGSTQPSSTIIPDSSTSSQVAFTIPASVFDNNTGTHMLNVTTTTGTSNSVMFTVFGPAGDPVVLTSPHGGETWTQGETHTISWANIPLTDTLNLALEDYSKDPAVITQIARIQPGQNSYSWTIPSNLSGNGFRMAVTYNDESDNTPGKIISGNFFNIVAPLAETN